ncbi:AI-2E family transporter, partial [Clostridium perfringens]
FIKFLLPQLIDSVVGLVNDIPTYIINSRKFFNEVIIELDLHEENSQILIDSFNNLVNYVIRFATNLIPALGGFVARILSSIWNVILGIVISVYLLIDKDNLCALSKKVTFGLFPESYANELVKLVHKSNYTFGRFLVGKIIDSMIIG